MGELTVQFPLHRHVLSDFTFDDQRHSHPSKGLGVHELCHQCTVTGCLLMEVRQQFLAAKRNWKAVDSGSSMSTTLGSPRSLLHTSLG